LTTNYVLCRKSTDLSLEGDEPGTAAAEEAFVPAAEESAPFPQGETVASAAEATLPEASMVEGEYAADAQPYSSSSHSPREADPVFLLMIGAEVEGSAIPEVVPVVPEPEVATGATTEPVEVASGVAPGVAEEVRDDVLPESSLEVVVRSPEIQDAKPIRSAPMSEAAATSRGGLELLANDLVNLTTVARNLEAMRRAEQWMKVHDCTLE
jgi:hypothetical protein